MAEFSGKNRSIGSRLWLVAVLGALAAASACASTGEAGAARPQRVHADMQVLSRQDLLATHFTNAYEAVQALRANWLESRATTFLGANGSDVTVYLDNVRLGNISELRAIALTPIVYIRHYDGTQATERWGMNHTQGVIFVSTHPM